MGQVLLALMFAFPAPVAAWSPATPPPESVSNNASVVHAGLPPVPGGVGRIAASAVAMHGKVYLLGGYTVDAQKAEASLANVDAYPGQYDLNETGQPVLVDRARLDLFLQTVRSFAAENHLPVAFTEFGSHRTAPNVATYLQDRSGPGSPPALPTRSACTTPRRPTTCCARPGTPTARVRDLG